MWVRCECEYWCSYTIGLISAQYDEHSINEQTRSPLIRAGLNFNWAESQALSQIFNDNDVVLVSALKGSVVSNMLIQR